MLLEITVLLATNVALGIGDPLYDDEEKRIYNFGLGKRAYSYVSEYKRLPVYNFGLGKRSENKNSYVFALGKQDDSEESNSDDLDVEKRGKAYDFGLGKRLTPAGYNFGLGKKAAPQYAFGLGKRIGYNFGLGKRQGKYAFGLGKKDKPYSFGLGKRNDYYPVDSSNEADDELKFNDIDDEKRSRFADGQKFSFGLGKRENVLGDLLDNNDISAENLSERQIRGQYYDFGLGKRSLELPLKSISQSSETKEIRHDSKTTQ